MFNQQSLYQISIFPCDIPWLSNYPLVMTNIAMEAMSLIEIDALPIENGGSFHGELLVITKW